MIIPENNIPFDDTTRDEADDQQSQKDIHSNGLDLNDDNSDDAEVPNTSMLQQAYDAAEPSYTLDLDKEDKKDEDEAD